MREAIEERDSARDALVQLRKYSGGVPTWHDLIDQAIVLLRAMPEDSRTETMNQWASSVAIIV